MKMTSPLLLVLWLLVSFAVVPAFARPEAKVTVKVLDEDGKPISNANVTICFSTSPPRELRKGLSDKDGLFTAAAPCVGRAICSVNKEGCYYSTGEYWFRDADFLRWTPWNPTFELILKRIGQPVPMYARDMRIDIPELGKPIGFDLVEADWVAPYGRGKVGDFVFSLTQKYRNWNDFEATMNITFSNPGDGIQSVTGPPETYNGSELRLSRCAPADGYGKQWTAKVEHGPNGIVQGEPKRDRYFFFRVRSAEANGPIAKSLYGKIHGDIEFYPRNSRTAWVRFCYYLNPDGTRNVEFDPKRNLFKNLGPAEGVSQP